MVELLKHNKITVSEAEGFISKGQDFCVVNPCGSGKTFVMAAIIDNHTDKTFTMITKQKNAEEYYLSKSDLFNNVKICTYNKLLNDFKNGNIDEYNTDFLFIDEAHYIGAEKWRLPIGCIKNRFKPIMIGFTATPQRFEQQGTDNTIITYYFCGNSAGNFTSQELQKDGVFIEPECIVSYYNLDNKISNAITKINESDIRVARKQELVAQLNNVKSQWYNSSRPEILLNKHLPKYLYREYSNRILVYSSDVATLNMNKHVIEKSIKAMYPDKKISTYAYTYNDNEKPFKEFTKDDDSFIKILFSIDKVMETIHINDLNILIMMRPSLSDRIITQQYGRINNTNNPRKSLILDFVDNIDNLHTYGPVCSNENVRYDNIDKHSVHIPNFSYINEYRKIFKEIDKKLSKYGTFNYKGVTSTLTFFAEAYNCDKKKLEECIKDGMCISSAIRESKNNIDLTSKAAVESIDKAFSEKKRLYNHEGKNEKLSQTEIVELVNRFIEKRQIKDEDIKQELYLTALSYNVKKAAIYSLLDKQLRLICKYNDICEDIYVPIDELDTHNVDNLFEHQYDYVDKKPIDTTEDKIFNSELNSALHEASQRVCNNNQRRIIGLYFGIENFKIYADKDIQSYYHKEPRTYTDVAWVLNRLPNNKYSMYRVGSIVNTALRNLRRNRSIWILNGYMHPFNKRKI